MIQLNKVASPAKVHPMLAQVKKSKGKKISRCGVPTALCWRLGSRRHLSSHTANCFARSASLGGRSCSQARGRASSTGCIWMCAKQSKAKRSEAKKHVFLDHARAL